jgi:hypothetical protein
MRGLSFNATSRHLGESRNPFLRHSEILRQSQYAPADGLVEWNEGSRLSPGKRIAVVGSVDADRRAEGLADRSVEDEVGDWVEAGWLAVYDYQCCAVVFRQFREGGGGINHQ